MSPVSASPGSSDGSAASAATFSSHAAGYDAMRRGLIPCFDDFYGTALDVIDGWRGERGLTRPLKVLELGAGTGLFSAMLLDRHPDSQMLLVDAAAGMLDLARQRLAGRDGINFAVADMLADDLGGPGAWDLVISALAIHHLDHQAKQSLFAKLHGVLQPGGLFVNAEQVLGPTPAAEARYVSLWLAQVAARGVPPDEIARALERQSFDQCAPVEDQLAWLRTAGFVEVDCPFKSWRFAVLTAQKG